MTHADHPGNPYAGGDRPPVALLTSRFLPFSQTFVYAQVAHYRRYDPEVFVRSRLNEDRFPGYRVCALTPGGPLRHMESLVQSVTGHSSTFVARLEAGRHRLLHAQFGWQGVLAVPLLERVRIPLLVTFRGRDVGRVAGSPGVPNPWLASRRRRLFAMASQILAVSQELVDRLLEAGAPPERVRVWRDGIEIPLDERTPRRSREGSASEPLRVLMAGRFVEKKGFEYGLEAFAEFVAAGHDARLAIVGEGELRARYERSIRRLGIGDRVEMTGELAHRMLLDRIADSDVFVVPSVRGRHDDREGVPSVLKEASARRVPVIGTRHGGIPEALVDGVTGLLVPERDPNAIARALAALAGDPALRVRLGSAGREKMVREYDIVRQVADLEDIYDEVLAGAAR